MMRRRTRYLLLYSILVLALSFRLYGINWDDGYHLHPDERAIILAILNLRFPETISNFFLPESSWNTHFFAYGSFPFYLLWSVSKALSMFDPKLASYDGIQLVGRFLSALFDVGTVFLLYLLGTKLKHSAVGLLAAGLYAVSVLPIQLSHFFAVDTLLTFFLTLLLFLLLLFYEKPTTVKSLAIGIVFGFALATKISASVILVSLFLTLALDFVFIFLRQPHKPHVWSPHLPPFLIKLFKDMYLIAISLLTTYMVLSPYTFIDFVNFQKQTAEQSQMTKNAFTFPYTFQYVGKIPYLYEIVNIFLFGLGPILATICLLGILFVCVDCFKKREKKYVTKYLILLIFFISYLAVVGSFAIGFMRYMLPLYPLLCLFGGIFLYAIYYRYFKMKPLLSALCSLPFALILLIWPLSFLSIYSYEHTRITATTWIMNNIPEGKTIALEHWDDGLPLSGIEKYNVLTLPMYEPDTREKWQLVDNYLLQTDYIILASNRLYVPLARLTQCDKLPQGRCYIRTSLYYKSLFDGTLGFRKVAEFHVSPSLPLTTLTIDDQKADESFTVYDHPKVIIFQKEKDEAFGN